MARAVTSKLYRTFVRGLITEASELTYPENATIAEDNCIIYRKGNRSRRLGVRFEPGYSASPVSVSSANKMDGVINEYVWSAVAEDSSLNFLCVQVRNRLYFYNLNAAVTSGARLPFSVNLSAFATPNTTNNGTVDVQMAGGKGDLFVVGENIEPFRVTYNPSDNTISTEQIFIQIRDFKGLDDGLANDEEPLTLSAEHHYNLKNQGWVDSEVDGLGPTQIAFTPSGQKKAYSGAASSPIAAYFSENARYPGNNKQWWAARDANTNAFDPELLKTMYTGNNRAPRGHYIVDAFYIDRSGMSGVSGIPVEATPTRPVSVAFFAGRVWYLSGSTVYFSQVLDNPNKAGMCYQEADPTSEDINELLPTDGGVVPIPEMSYGVKLVPLGDGIVIFAKNGIWYISGSDSGFSAMDLSVSKINPIGTDGAGSIVEAEGQIYWWSRVGIMAMAPKMGQFGPVDGVFDKVNITEQTIQSMYIEEIPLDRKKYVKGMYDPGSNVIQWLYSDDETLPLKSYNRVLNLDLTLQAFYPWSVDTSTGCRIAGIFLTPHLNRPDHPAIKPTFFKFILTRDLNNNGYEFFFGNFDSPTFSDWSDDPETELPYMSFAETGYELAEDAMRKKMTPWIYTYFRRSEENLVDNGAGDFDLDKPSSCFFQVKWDWANSEISNKYSAKVQAYRHTRLPLFNEDNLAFDTGYPVVVTRHKVRGAGRAIQFRFECNEIGKDFDLLGWAGTLSGNTQP